jgi:hypothetical protein
MSVKPLVGVVAGVLQRLPPMNGLTSALGLIRMGAFGGQRSAVVSLAYVSVKACLCTREYSMVFKMFDVPGIFARDLQVMVDFATEWYAKRLKAPEIDGLPRKLVYLVDNMPSGDAPQKESVMGIVRDIEIFMDDEASGVSVEGLWNADPPEDAHGASLHEFLKDVSTSTHLATSLMKEGWRKHIPLRQLPQHHSLPCRLLQNPWHRSACEQIRTKAMVSSLSPLITQILMMIGVSESSTQKHSTKKACAV